MFPFPLLNIYWDMLVQISAFATSTLDKLEDNPGMNLKEETYWELVWDV